MAKQNRCLIAYNLIKQSFCFIRTNLVLTYKEKNNFIIPYILKNKIEKPHIMT